MGQFIESSAMVEYPRLQLTITMHHYLICIVEVYTHLSYSLSVQQTPSRPQTELPKKIRKFTNKKPTKNQHKKQITET